MIAKEEEIKIPSIDPLVESFKEIIGYYRLLVKQKNQLKNLKESLGAKGTSSALIKTIDKQLRALAKEQKELIASMRKSIEELKGQVTTSYLLTIMARSLLNFIILGKEVKMRMLRRRVSRHVKKT